MTKIIACIASRMESTRLKQKTLVDIKGYPMTQWLVERLKTCKNLDEITLCTPNNDANKILRDKAVNEWGVHAHAGPLEDVLMNYIEATEKLNGTHFIRVTGDNIFTDPQYLDVMIEKHLESGADYSRIEGLPLGVTAECMELEYAKRVHASIKDPADSGYTVLFSFKPDLYDCVVLDCKADHNRPNLSLTVDTQSDLDQVMKIINAFPDEKWGPNLTQIIEWSDSNPNDRIDVSDDTPIKMPKGVVITFKQFKDNFNQHKLSARHVGVDEYELS